MSHWKEKHVVVLGGSAGLGFHLATAWHAAGAAVTVVGRDKDRLAAAAARIRDQRDSSEVTTIAADVTKDADVERLFAQLDQIDVLVNAFGRSARGKLEDATPADFAAMLEINLLAVVRCVRGGLARLQQSRGSIVNIGSLAAKLAPRFLSTYPTTKFALAGYTEQLRRELADEGVHVLLVCPGPIKRSDAGQRYAGSSADIPAQAQLPGGGAKTRPICPSQLSQQIIQACAARRPELIVPAKARWLDVIAAWSPVWGDYLIRRFTT